MLLKNILADRQTQARSHAGGMGLVRFVEALQNVGLISGVDAGTIVLHQKADAVALAQGAQGEHASGTGHELYCVIDEVGEHLVDAAYIAHHVAGIRSKFNIHINPLFLDALFKADQDQ